MVLVLSCLLCPVFLLITFSFKFLVNSRALGVVLLLMFLLSILAGVIFVDF